MTTIRNWIVRALAGDLVPCVLGRPRSLLRLMRRTVLELFWENPKLGPRRLRGVFPGNSRRVLADWKERVVRRLARRRARELAACWWPVVGAVWAMDHTHLAARLADGTRETLVVRDMTSGMLFATSPARLHHGPEVAAELALLILEHGAPLVIKCDNGSMLICQHVRAVCEAWGIVLLRSPVQCPSFNGGCERSLGWWKEVLEPWAQEGIVDEEDLEQARRLVNELQRERGPSAAEIWSSGSGRASSVPLKGVSRLWVRRRRAF